MNDTVSTSRDPHQLLSRVLIAVGLAVTSSFVVGSVALYISVS